MSSIMQCPKVITRVADMSPLSWGMSPRRLEPPLCSLGFAWQWSKMDSPKSARIGAHGRRRNGGRYQCPCVNDNHLTICVCVHNLKVDWGSFWPSTCWHPGTRHGWLISPLYRFLPELVEGKVCRNPLWAYLKVQHAASPNPMIIIIFSIKLQTCSILWFPIFPLFWTIPLKYVKETWFPANVPLNSACFFQDFQAASMLPCSHAQDRGPCLDAGAAVGEVGSWANLSHGTEIGGVLDQQRSAPWLWGVGPGPSGHLPGRHFVKLHRERQRNVWKRGQLIPGASFAHVVFFIFILWGWCHGLNSVLSI